MAKVRRTDRAGRRNEINPSIGMRKGSWQGLDKLTRLIPIEYASNKIGVKSEKQGQGQDRDSQREMEGKAHLPGLLGVKQNTSHSSFPPPLLASSDGSWLEVNCVRGPVSHFYDLLVQSFNRVRI